MLRVQGQGLQGQESVIKDTSLFSNNVNNYKVIEWFFFNISYRFQPLVINRKINSKQFRAKKQKNQ